MLINKDSKLLLSPPVYNAMVFESDALECDSLKAFSDLV